MPIIIIVLLVILIMLVSHGLVTNNNRLLVGAIFLTLFIIALGLLTAASATPAGYL